MGSVNTKDALNEAIRTENQEKLRSLCKKEPNLINDYINKTNCQTSLCMAIYYGSMKSVTTLIEEFNAEINKPDAKDGLSPLLIACKRKETLIAAFLISKGSDVEYKNKSLNCLDYSILYAAYDVSHLIINKCPTLKLKSLEEYLEFHKELKLPIFNIIKFYECLKENVLPTQAPSFRMSFNAADSFEGKVPDPKESWHEFIGRIMKFKLYNPPMVDKNNVPLEQRKTMYMKIQSKLLEIEYDKKITLDDDTNIKNTIDQHIAIELNKNDSNELVMDCIANNMNHKSDKEEQFSKLSFKEDTK